MLTVITDPDRLASAQALFTETIRTALPQRIICTVSGVVRRRRRIRPN